MVIWCKLQTHGYNCKLISSSKQDAGGILPIAMVGKGFKHSNFDKVSVRVQSCI